MAQVPYILLPSTSRFLVNRLFIEKTRIAVSYEVSAAGIREYSYHGMGVIVTYIANISLFQPGNYFGVDVIGDGLMTPSIRLF